MRDLTFGGDDWLTLSNSDGRLRRIATDDPRLEVYGAGDLDEPGFAEAVRSRDFSGLSGRFMVALLDQERHVVSVTTDRHGQFPVFLAHAGGKVLVSTRVQTMLDRAVVDRRANRGGMADALAFGVPFEQKTLVEGVESFPSGSRIDFDLQARKASSVRLWDSAAILRDPGGSFEETKERLFDHFMAGFDHWAKNNKVAITLSGGIDSRCFLAAAHHRSLPVSTFNCSVAGSRSAAYARKMAEMAQVPYFDFPVGEEFGTTLAARVRGVVSLTEGMTFSSEVECHWLRERVSGATVVLHGAFAELSKLDSMHLYFADRATEGAKPETLAAVLWPRFSSSLQRSLAVFAPTLREELFSRAKQSLVDRVAKVASSGLGVLEILQVLYIEELLQKVTKYSAVIWNDRIPTRFPFAFPRYLDLLLRTRSHDRMTQLFQMYQLKRTWRPLFSFPDANTGLRVDAPEVLNRAVAIVDKARRVLSTGHRACDHSNPRYWLSKMVPKPEDILFAHGNRTFDAHAMGRLLRILREPARSRNPLTLLRQRMAQYRAASVVQQALTLSAWLEQTGIALV